MSGGDTCLTWLPRCGAECCKQVRFKFSDGVHPKALATCHFPIKVNPDNVRYLALHNIRVVHGRAVVDLRKFKHQLVGDELTIFSRCELLTPDLRCSGHPDNKPIQCRELGWTSRRCDLTSNCLFLHGSPPVSPALPLQESVERV